MQISSTTPSVQMLKAQQAWEARRARQSAQPEATPEVNSQPTSPLQRTRPAVSEPLAATPALPQGQWGQTVQEVQSIAKKAGYIGVTEQDIRRAYTLGESLLADYRV
jgi:hypothetical protein